MIQPNHFPRSLSFPPPSGSMVPRPLWYYCTQFICHTEHASMQGQYQIYKFWQRVLCAVAAPFSQHVLDLCSIRRKWQTGPLLQLRGTDNRWGDMWWYIRSCTTVIRSIWGRPGMQTSGSARERTSVVHDTRVDVNTLVFTGEERWILNPRQNLWSETKSDLLPTPSCPCECDVTSCEKATLN